MNTICNHILQQKGKNGEETEGQNSKQKCSETNPVFLIEKVSTSTLVNTSETSLLNNTQTAAAGMT